MRDPEKVETNERAITLTCPICEQKLSFLIPEEELERIKSGIIKKAINHFEKHVVVVYIDSVGNVKRMYGYECIEIGARPLCPERSCSVVTLSIENEKSLNNDTESFIRTLIKDMERLSKEQILI